MCFILVGRVEGVNEKEKKRVTLYEKALYTPLIYDITLNGTFKKEAHLPKGC